MMWPNSFGARIGAVDLLRTALVVVGQHDPHLLACRTRLHVLGAVHRWRAAGRRRGRVDDDVGLGVESVGGEPSPNTRSSHVALPSSS